METTKNLKVNLASCGNPDLGQNLYKPMSEAATVPVSDFNEASKVCRDYISRHNLGGGNWAGGEVHDEDGNLVAKISYNGRVWPVESKEPA